jgi:NADPH:quinone reductase-like Zn-dependent oxidoreductase
MRAIVYERYGPPEVLQLVEIDKPAPRDNEVLIKIMATSVHKGDTRMRSLDIPGPGWQKLMARLVLGFNKPKNPILGMELAGTIEAVGKNVSLFKTGEEVFAETMWSGFGAYAEYKCMPEDGVLALKPTNMNFEQAAVMPAGGITTVGILKLADIQPGQQVLIYGASGSVGAFSVQLAKAFGAEVTGVCSTANLELVRSLGADQVIDYTQEEFSQRGVRYDLILDAVGLYKGDYQAALKESGIFLNVDSASDKIKKSEVRNLLLELKQLIESNQMQAVIDRRYPMEQIVEAHRYVDKGHKKGNVVLNIV